LPPSSEQKQIERRYNEDKRQLPRIYMRATEDNAVRVYRVLHIRGQSIMKEFLCNSEPGKVCSMFAMVALRSADFKLHSDATSITLRQIVTELNVLESVCV